jgi:lipopolysaccharide/colanic/teichoic acid biosynthesis glycosyltransferase
MRQAGIGFAAKRALDIVVAFTGLGVTAPLTFVAAVLVRGTMGAPVLFRQQRPGRDGKPFQLVKFRTMRDATDGCGRPLPDAERLTAVGRFLRASSIDELPQLWNVLRGDMSLVGPRPLLMQYLPRYDDTQQRRHHVLPGITGWAQIHGRNAVSWEEKFALDVWYVDNWSPVLDLRILWRTCGQVLSRRGVAAEGHVTMPEFQGTRTDVAGAS